MTPLEGPGDPPPVKRLNGNITKRGDLPFAGGTYCEVWVGSWDKGGEAGREGGGPEKVSVGLVTLTLLTSSFVGGFEGT